MIIFYFRKTALHRNLIPLENRTVQGKCLLIEIVFTCSVFLILYTSSCSTFTIELAWRDIPGEKEVSREEELDKKSASERKGLFRGISLDAAVEEIFLLVNDYREQHGLKPLSLHSELSEISREHSEDMAVRNFYSHVDPAGVGPDARIKTRLSVRYYLLGTAENIAYRESSDGSLPSTRQISKQFMDGWMSSPGHRANILRREMTHI